MMNARAWKPRNPAEAFFPVEMRPLYMPTADAINDFQQLKRHFAVVDVERQNPFAVVTDDYELVTNDAAFDMAAEVMKKVFYTTELGDMECLNITMPKTRSFCHIDLIHKTANFAPWEKDEWTAFLRILHIAIICDFLIRWNFNVNKLLISSLYSVRVSSRHFNIALLNFVKSS